MCIRDRVVDNTCVIAANFGVSQNFIGLTIIAIGTSLPELVTSDVYKRQVLSIFGAVLVIGSATVYNLRQAKG